MHVLFLGGTRFIGHWAATVALQRGHSVTLLHRGTTPKEVDDAAELIADRNAPEALAVAVARAKPDVVVDMRAMTRSDAEASALAAKIATTPVVVVSSQDVYAQFQALNGIPGPAPRSRVDEDAPLTIPKPFASLGPHEGGPDYDKKDVEDVFRGFASETGRAAMALRLPGVHGPRDPKRRFVSIRDSIAAGVTTFPSAPPGRSLRLTHVHVLDAAEAIVRAAEVAPRSSGFDAINVGEVDTPTMRERVVAIARALDREVSFYETDETLPPDLALLGAFPNDCVLDVTKLERVLGFRALRKVEPA